MTLSNLGDCLLSSYERTGLLDSLDSAITAFREASTDLSGSHLIRVRIATKWASIAHQNDHPSALEAYKIALDLLRQLAALSLDVRSRQSILAMAGLHNIASDAAAWAIKNGQYETAIEHLEVGRSVFWSL
jgi:thioredoxin-like negative regulator of GroEL